jgi:hypothetical protein
VPLLAAILEHGKSGDLRRETIGLLAAIGWRAKAALPALRACTTDSDQAIAETAQEALKRIDIKK